MVFCLLLLLTSCFGNITLDEDENQETQTSNNPTIDNNINEDESQEKLSSEVPIINEYLKDSDYELFGTDYVYLTDMSGVTPITFVEKGDMFLGWRAEKIEVAYEKYEDGSISCLSAHVKFSGETEIQADLEYWEYDPQTDKGGCIIVTVHNESKHLIPNLPNRVGREIFIILMDESDEQFAEIFSETDGYTIGDCRIIIRDYAIVFAFTDAFDVGYFVDIKR
jgi:hypothetical protein